MLAFFFKVKGNVDGRNPAPVDMVNIPLFTRFYTCQVVQDFFHQQYLPQGWMQMNIYILFSSGNFRMWM